MPIEERPSNAFMLKRSAMLPNKRARKKYIPAIVRIDRFTEKRHIEVEEGTNLPEALKSVAAVEVRKVGDRIKVVSTDGEEGFYVYEVDGEFPDKTVDEYEFYEDSVVEWKKLIPVTRKRLFVNIRR